MKKFSDTSNRATNMAMMFVSGRKIPRKILLSKRVASFLDRRDCIYKDKSYVGPVHVDSAVASYRWLKISLETKPWQIGKVSRRAILEMPVEGTSANGFSITVNAGYGINGIFVYAPAAVLAISKLYERGAALDQILQAINSGRGLPEAVFQLRFKKFSNEF